MNDKELLILAGKAVGVTGEWRDGHGICPPELHGRHHFYWNPLTDDGDALRLAVKLNIDIRFVSEPDGAAVHCFGTYDEFPDCDLPRELIGKDACASTRLAITRAAAEIGRNMP